MRTGCSGKHQRPLASLKLAMTVSRLEPNLSKVDAKITLGCLIALYRQTDRTTVAWSSYPDTGSGVYLLWEKFAELAVSNLPVPHRHL